MKIENNCRCLNPIIIKNKDMFTCPICGEGDLNISNEQEVIVCTKCSQSFNCTDGIPLLFWSNKEEFNKKDVTDTVKSFYEETPFPNYEGLDSVASFRKKAEKSVFARLLDDQVSYDSKILEAGCGTGQLSNYLSMTGQRSVFGTDMCINSLKLGYEFKEKNNLDNVAFLQMNLFRPVFKPESFDLVICNGVLHHTGDPFGGFQSILRLVKKNGFIIIGLYNAYGRIITDIRRLIFRYAGNSFQFLDPRLRDKTLSDVKRHTWFMDQYQNPHESKHTIGEVLKWFDKCGVEFINSIPKSNPIESFTEEEKLFKANLRGTWFDHFLVQLGMIFTGSQEGGFFTMFGRKKF